MRKRVYEKSNTLEQESTSESIVPQNALRTTSHQPLVANQQPTANHQPPTSPIIQTKLTLGAIGDRYEQEADNIANQITNNLALSQPHSTVQRAALAPPTASTTPVNPSVETAINQARGGGQPLAETVRQPMEQAFGADFSHVRVHTGQQADELNQSLQARAFTTGRDIFFRQGQSTDTQLLAHELTHVVQQNSASSTTPAIQRAFDPAVMDTYLDLASPLPTEDFDTYFDRLHGPAFNRPLNRFGYDYQPADRKALEDLIRQKFPQLTPQAIINNTGAPTIPAPPAGQPIWTLDETNAKDLQQPTATAKTNYEVWTSYVKKGWHPKRAAEHTCDSKYSKLQGTKTNMHEFRVGGSLRITFIPDKDTTTVTVYDRYGHT